jgi:hypothetical protein
MIKDAGWKVLRGAVSDLLGLEIELPKQINKLKVDEDTNRVSLRLRVNNREKPRGVLAGGGKDREFRVGDGSSAPEV